MSAAFPTDMVEFLEGWKGQSPAKALFEKLGNLLAGLDGTALNFVARPGVTYSLRGKHANQTDKELFVMVDVIEDPDERWLSVCFYEAMISDPDEMGEYAPGGLMGEDAVCFDLDPDADEKLVSYVGDRIREAHAAC
ncbi:MAG: hypothetical protein ACNI3A_11110 [Desulfovibrio sp.]|uniref:hypothetical protein n=1 Tax=Desulfovibrio sp. 7SRBS1 TaxID=3378064 RepID=UPI003B3EF552